jgi:uracil-DNA glycosylase family 4
MERKHPLAKCEECPLYEGGRFVPSVGPEKAKFAFVGETPAADDTRKGEPFTGPSGKLLNIVMEHHGIKREEVFLTNATLCRPPGGEAPARSAILACRDRLDAEILDRGVEQVVALGNSASEATVSRSGVTKLRIGPGRPHSRLDNVHVISTLQPAACLRQGDMFPYLVADVGKLVTPRIQFEEPEFVVVDDELTALQAIKELKAFIHLVVDIEVDIEKDTAFDHPDRYGMLCIGVAYAPNKAVIFGEEACKIDSVLDGLADLFGRAETKLIAQNGKFDLAGLYPLLGPLTLWFDTMLASYVFDERPGVHGLKYQAQEYLGAPPYDDVIKKYVGPKDGYGVVPRPILYKYNAYDVCCTYKRWLQQEELFKLPANEGLRKVHDFLVAASNQFMYLELNGIAIDTEYLDQLTEEYLQSLEEIVQELSEVARRGKGAEHQEYDKASRGRRFINPASPKQVKEWLLDNGVRVDSTNEDTLNLIIDRCKKRNDMEVVVEFCTILLKHRREAKLYGTYIKGVRKRLFRGRVYPTFLLHGTTSGRTACRNPNLQNIPRESKIRRLYIPAKEENVFVHVDYSQAELRVLSFLAGDTYFRDIFNSGDRDLFDELTPVLYPSANHNRLSAGEWKELRIRVKAFVYGLSYGREPGSIASEFSLSYSDAMVLQANFFSVIPEIVEFRKEVRQRVRDGKDLITPWGRRRRYTLITKENERDIMNEALAFLPQSTASDMCVQALTWLRPELKGKGFIRNIIHDALLAECHRDAAEEVAALIDKRMIQSAQTIVGDYVNFATDYKIGKNWGEV